MNKFSVVRVSNAIISLLFVGTGQPLWQNLEYGMSRAEVRALYPHGTTLLTPDCEARILPRYTRGALTSVSLRFGDIVTASRDRWNQALRCQEIIKVSLDERYGSPVQSGVQEGLPPMRELSDTAVYVSGQLRIELSARQRQPFTVVTYGLASTPQREVRPDAAGKL